nr:MerR family transcriptional regulator [uncultured Psychroserpens sp.]
MLIGQLSIKTGLSRDTIRFYEKQGLIPIGIKNNEFNTYKDYSNETLEKLIIIKKMKGFGLTLNEISDVLDLLDSNSASCENVSEKMFEKVKLIDHKIKELRAMKRLITNGIKSCSTQETESSNCPLIFEDIN